MSAVPRLLPASRRFYSSFFSSRSGGGRYFGSSKSPKSSVIAAATRQTAPKGSPPASASKPSGCSPSSQDGGDMKHTQSGKNSSDAVDARSTGEAAQPGSPAHSPSPSGVKAGEPTNASTSRDVHGEHGVPFPPNEGTITATWFLPTHPTLNPKDFKLHQFFSLHRPLLLLSNPSSILHSAPPSDPIFSAVEEQASSHPLFTSDSSSLPSPPPNLLSSAYNASSIANAYYDIPDTSSDADAEAARQLARALAMNRVGSTTEWEGTLRSLGLDINLEPERVQMREQMEREWEDVMMESTKRKRGKKMKKHKLKKRRRLTRSTRLKIGR